MNRADPGFNDELTYCQLVNARGTLEPSSVADLPGHVSRRLIHFILKRIHYVENMAFRRRLGSSVQAGTSSAVALNLQSGERVRVKSYDDIRATLDNWCKLRGCAFMEGMKAYCGSEQIVHKKVERFLDERYYQIRKTRGIVILEGLQCDGAIGFGRCDRSCYYFWREEWLEKIQ